MTDEEQEEKYPLSEEEKHKWQIWVPKGYKITNMQIYEAIERGIKPPTGDKTLDQEYIQFLNEHTLKPKEKKTIPIPPGPIPPGPVPEYKRKKRKGLYDRLLELLDKLNIKKEITDEFQEDLDDKQIESKINKIKDELNDSNKKENAKEKLTKEIDEELDKYIKELEQELEKEEENKVLKIVERKKMFVLPLILAMVLAMLLSCFKIEDKIIRETIAKEIVTKTITYELEEHITYEEAMKKAMEDIKLGDEYQLENGQRFNINSLGTGSVTKELGKEFNAENKFEGKYPITGFSIIRNSDNKMLAYIEDFYDQTRTDSLATFVDESLKDTNIGYDDIRIEFHFGRTALKTGEKSRLGWIEDNNVVLNHEEIEKIINEAATYQGSIENFNDSHITIDTKDGKVRIPIKDKDGNYYNPGKIVTGSDNKQYQISSLVEEEETKMVEETQERVDGKKISFDIKDCSLLAGAPFALLALSEYLKKKKMNEEAQKNPYYTTIKKSEEDEYIEKFHDTKSKFGRTHEGTIYEESEFNQKNEILKQAYYEMTGTEIRSEYQLISLVREMSRQKRW